MKKLYKFLRTDLKSHYGDCTWKVGEWKHEDEVKLCSTGFHASDTPLQALGYVPGEILSVVEVKGKSKIENDKSAWSDMRVVKAYLWQKKDSVAFSIYAAELCIENFEKIYPDDKRPREAIEAAKKWLIDPSPENESAASSASSAAWVAESAARSAAWEAESAESAWSAESAARSARSAALSVWVAEAAWSAASSASSVESAARSASSAGKDLIKKIDAWFIKRIKVLEKYDK